MRTNSGISAQLSTRVSMSRGAGPDGAGSMASLVIAKISVLLVVVRCCWGNTEPDCDWQRVLSVGDEPEVTVSLKCKLRTIGNADSVLSNLTSAQMDMITTLHLECSDVLFFESSLDVNSFLTQLHRLRDLRLEFCKIRHIPPGILSASRELKQLVLRTHNTDWSAMTMQFDPNAFRGLTQLKNLNLSDNNIWDLPDELFCPLYSLTHLNMSRNRLQDVLELGFSDWGNGPSAPGKTCNVGLEELDVSMNDIFVIPDNAFTSLRSLQRMLLQENAIASMADRAFVGLVSLQFLNASSNQLAALPPELFQSTRDLREIYLNNNSISVLAPGLLEGLDQLQVLDLSHNELTSAWVNRDTFSGLVRLIVLNLGHNKLSKIDSHVFQDLYSMQILNLEYNEIECIAEGAFVTLSNLHALTLSHNKLRSIESTHFTGLYVLNQLFLDHNDINTIDKKSFQNCSNLQDLGLSGNELIEIPDGINELRFLKTLDLGENNISNIVNSSFQGLDQLYGLRLIENQIVNVSKDSFSTLPSLQVLNLAYNQIKHVDKGAFGTSPTLHAIRLDGNQLKDINGMFLNLPGLIWLNVSDNQLQWFDYALIPQSLEWLDMHKNNVADLGNYFEKSENIQIKMLDASFNRLTEINENSIPDSVETLFLNDNLIKKVKVGTFQKKSNLSRVVLFANKIQTLDLAALRLDPIPENKELPQFYLGNNPIHCDCTMEWLQRINQLSHLRQHPRVMDLDSVTCHLTHSRGSPTKPLMDLKPSQFLCPYETHCFALCHCCDFDACDCEMTCPANCTCYHDHTWSANVVDCSNAGYTSVPTKIPMDATEIYLDGNDLGELGSHVFIGKKKLEILFLNNSNIESLHNRTFNGVTSLRVLHMENNHLHELRGFEFDQLENLNELYLDHNEIKNVGNNTFKSMKTLEVLKLESNKIVNFKPWEQLSSEILSTVSLEGNIWTCTNCENIGPMEIWLKENSNTLNPDKLLCSDGKTTLQETIKRCTEHRDSAAATSAVHRNTLYSTSILGSDYVPFVAGSLVVFIIILLVTILGFIFRKEVSLWVHSKYGVRVLSGGGHGQDDRLYDAYMVYSVKDEEFVSQVIATSLERSGYSLCLHYRDLHVMSPSYLTDSILGASDAARRILIVLSLSFLQNEWERPPFRAALQACLERTRTRRSKVILLLTTDIGPDPELQLLVKACKVISWGEKRFWEKLRYVMPDVKKKTGDALKKVVVEGKSGARYTAAPTSTETWYRMSPASITQSSAPTGSTCVSEESSQRTTDEEEEPHSYVSIDYQQQRPPRVHHHVYSCIPDPQAGQGRTYFV